MRPNKVEYYLNIANEVLKRSTCLRRNYGAVIVKDDRIVSTGYNGAPRCRKNCCEIGRCFRMEHNIPRGTMTEMCRACHAEMNAIINASKEEMDNATMYLVGVENDGTWTNADCCAMCKRVIINSGIHDIIARQSDGTYRHIDVQEWIDNDDSLDINKHGY